MKAREVSIRTDGTHIIGDLRLPVGADRLVIFAHGSGSSRFSKRNRHVTQSLNDRGIATLLIDLLTEYEESEDLITAELRFNIGFLADRLRRATDWARLDPETSGLRIGYFGASTGAAAALEAAADQDIFAVVSRGGRPDLADDQFLRAVKAPVLLIVGERDEVVIAMNSDAAKILTAEHKTVIVPKATHLFEESGALEMVADLARDWFIKAA